MSRRRPGIFRTWRDAGRFFAPIVVADAVIALLIALLLMGATSAPTTGQQPGPVLEVNLTGVGSVIVEARGTMENPRLPVAPLAELTGEDFPGGVQYIGVDELEDHLGVPVEYDERRALVEIRDHYSQLAASQARRDAAQARSRTQPNSVMSQTGPWFAATANDQRDARYEVGWNFGRVEAAVSHSDISGNAARIAANPFRRVWLSAQVDDDFEPHYSARVSAGRSFLTTSFDQGTEQLNARAATGVGPFRASVRASDLLEPDEDNLTPVVSFEASSFQAAVARTGDTLVGRVQIGARRFSPLAVPRVR